MTRFIIFIVVLLLSSFTTVSAVIGIPEIYTSAGISTSTTRSYTIDSIDSIKPKSTSTSSAINLNIGVRPFNVPIFGAFRIEGQYYKNFGNQTKISSLGQVLYYDIRLLPIITPYVGAGLHSMKIKLPVDFLDVQSMERKLY